VPKRLLFSVGLKDCKVDTFTVGGHGGSGKDTSNTGVRITHVPSGAIGKATDSRSQLQNKRLAMRRMGTGKEFLAWARVQASVRESIQEAVERQLARDLLKIETMDRNGRWVELKGDTSEDESG